MVERVPTPGPGHVHFLTSPAPELITFPNGDKIYTTDRRKWPGIDPILLSYPLPDLDAHGYLNEPNAHVQDIRPYEQAAKERDNQPTHNLPGNNSPRKTPASSVVAAIGPTAPSNWEDSLHPLFRFNRWTINRQDFMIIKPALQLASCLLDEPSIVPFFIGLGKRPMKVIKNRKARKAFRGQTLYTFEPHTDDNPETFRSDRVNAWNFLARDMPRYVTWRIGDNHEHSYATTSILKDTPGPVPGKTFGSIISLDMNYLLALKGQGPPETFPLNDQIQKRSRMLRTHFHLAIALLHELAHAVGYATVEHTLEEYKNWIPKPAEPFFRDDRMFELGFAFTQFIFGGVISPNGPPKECWCHYGLHLRDFPGAFLLQTEDNEELFEYKSAREDGVKFEWRYAVKMDYVQKMFTKKFWEYDLRHGDPNLLLKYQRTNFFVGTERKHLREDAEKKFDFRRWKKTLGEIANGFNDFRGRFTEHRGMSE